MKLRKLFAGLGIAALTLTTAPMTVLADETDSALQQTVDASGIDDQTSKNSSAETDVQGGDNQQDQDSENKITSEDEKEDDSDNPEDSDGAEEKEAKDAENPDPEASANGNESLPTGHPVPRMFRAPQAVATAVETDDENSSDGDSEDASETVSAEEISIHPVEWQYSNSKTISNWDAAAGTVDVSDTLPSAEQQLTTDIVFVVDVSSCASESAQKFSALMSDLAESQSSSGAAINVGVVWFRGAADIACPLTTLTSDNVEDIKNKIAVTDYSTINEFAQKIGKGSNIPAGLAAAADVLGKDTSTADSRKNVILISDGKTYLYIKDRNYSQAYSRSTTSEGSGSLYEWTDKYYHNYSGNLARPDTDLSMQAFINDIGDRRTQEYKDHMYSYYDQAYFRTSTASFQPDVEKSMGLAYNTGCVINCEESMWQTAKAVEDFQDKGIHFYAVNTSEDDSVFTELMTYLNGGAKIDFDAVKNDIYYQAGADSYVIDTMGPDFDARNLADMTITLQKAGQNETETYKAIADGSRENVYHFVEDSSVDGGYRYTVEYIPQNGSAADYLKWTMHVPVSNFEHVSLNYSELLVNRQTAAGTYDELVSTAVLYPTDSDSRELESVNFEEQKVSYTVPEGGNPDTPEPVNPEPNPGPEPEPTPEPAPEPTPAPETTPEVTPAAPEGQVLGVSRPAPAVAAEAAAVTADEGQVLGASRPAPEAQAQQGQVLGAQRNVATGDEGTMPIWLFLVAAAAAEGFLLLRTAKLSKRM